MRTPVPLCLTCWLCVRSQVRTNWLRCQVAFSQILRIGTRNPAFGALPTNAKAQKCGPDGLTCDDLRTEPQLIAHLRQQVQGPQRGRLVEGARFAVQDGDQLFDLLGRKGILSM